VADEAMMPMATQPSTFSVKVAHGQPPLAQPVITRDRP
jgi:hypothetical protein